MKYETILKRLDTYLTKQGTICVNVLNDTFFLSKLAEGNRVHPFSWQRKNGHYKLIGIEKMNRIKNVLDLLKVTYEIGNDAMRGGKEGEYIAVSNAAHRRKLRDIIKVIRAENGQNIAYL